MWTILSTKINTNKFNKNQRKLCVSCMSIKVKLDLVERCVKLGKARKLPRICGRCEEIERMYLNGRR